jgi:hypothetical protein
LQLGEPDADRAWGGSGSEVCGHPLESLADAVRADAVERADELVATDTHDQVIRPQVGGDRLGGALEQPVSGSVPRAVVDPLQTVHVDERKYERAGRSMGPLDLPIDRGESDAAAECAREIVDTRGGADVCGVFAIGGGESSVALRLLAIEGRCGTLHRCGAVGVVDLLLVSLRQPIADCGHAVALGRCLVATARHLVAHVVALVVVGPARACIACLALVADIHPQAGEIVR